MIDDLMRFVGLEPESDRLRREIIRRETAWGSAGLEAIQAINTIRAELDARQAEIDRLRGLLSIALGEMERADCVILSECGVGVVNANVLNEIRKALGGSR